MRDIELPDPLGQAGGADDEAAFQHHPGIDEGGGITRNENEQIGGVAEAIISRGDPVHDIVGNVIQENRPVRDPAKQVEPEIASFGGQGCVDFHGGRFENDAFEEDRAAGQGARRATGQDCHSAA